MKRYKSQLEAKVEGQNEVNRLAIEFLPKLLEAVKPWVGQKVLLATGCLSDKFRKTLPVLPNELTVSGHYTTGQGYSLQVDFRITVQYPESRFVGNKRVDVPNHWFTHYAEATVYIADFDGVNISRIYDNHSFKTDYTVVDVLKAREALKKAQAAVSKAQGRIYPFGEHDNH